MAYRELKERVWRANLDVVEAGLVELTWGNASGVDRQAGVMAIKPSGVPYDALQPEDIILLSLDDGRTIDSRLRPSSDTPTHLHLYRDFESIGGLVHTHPTHADRPAKSKPEIPYLRQRLSE